MFRAFWGDDSLNSDWLHPTKTIKMPNGWPPTTRQFTHRSFLFRQKIYIPLYGSMGTGFCPPNIYHFFTMKIRQMWVNSYIIYMDPSFVYGKTKDWKCSHAPYSPKISANPSKPTKLKGSLRTPLSVYDEGILETFRMLLSWKIIPGWRIRG